MPAAAVYSLYPCAKDTFDSAGKAHMARDLGSGDAYRRAVRCGRFYRGRSQVVVYAVDAAVDVQIGG